MFLLSLCVWSSGAPLFDSSSNFTDPQTLQLLRHSERLLSNLSAIFHCLLSEAQELTQKGDTKFHILGYEAVTQLPGFTCIPLLGHHVLTVICFEHFFHLYLVHPLWVKDVIFQIDLHWITFCVLGLAGLMNKNMVSSLISNYAQVVLWFCRTGLLPEGSGRLLLSVEGFKLLWQDIHS